MAASFCARNYLMIYNKPSWYLHIIYRTCRDQIKRIPDNV